MKRGIVKMEINRQNLKKLTELSDEALRKKIEDAASSCGIDPGKSAAYLTDMTAIKKKLSSLSDSQIKALLGALGEENVRKIKNGLDNGQR
jgi:hypothetical protein